MKNKAILMAAAAAALCLTPLAASAQNGPRSADGYYSQSDRNGYYDRDGSYRRMQEEQRREDAREERREDRREARREARDERNYYRQGAYEQNCQRGNAVAGTIFGAAAGGVLGSAVSRGNGGAVIGGAVLGGLLGNTIARDIDCNDQPYAFNVYSNGLNGQVGRRYDWNRGPNRGYFQPTREFRRSGTVCREFIATSYRGSREMRRNGVACRASDGNWRFD
jgi:surface antigen